VLIAASNAKPASPCELAANWVSAHRNSLPKHLDELAGFDAVHLRAVFRALTPKEQATLWHERLHQFMQPGAGLNGTQVAYVEQTDAMLDSLFIKLDLEQRRAALDRMRPRIVELFGRVKGAQIFTLAPYAAVRRSSQRVAVGRADVSFAVTEWVLINRALNWLDRRSTKPLSPCECNYQVDPSDCWARGLNCYYNPDPACQGGGTSGGCGLLGQFQCTGTCAG
jgi:hypothetical protein